MQGERAVVTGGAGFIGSHLCEALLREGLHVTVLDNFCSGSLDNLASHLQRYAQRLRIVEGDVRDGRLVNQVLEESRLVFHLAALTSVEDSIRRPQVMNAANLDGILSVLEACRGQGVRKLVFASSTAVYGQTPEPVQDESLLPSPESPYAVTKLAGEHYCRVYSEVFDVPTISLRYFNVYGPRQSAESDYAAVIPRFIQAIDQGRTPTIFGDGLQTRDFIYVGDVVEANLAAARSPVCGKCFNVATGESRNLLELVDILGRLIGKSVQPEFAPARAGEVRHSRGATERASRELGFEARFTLEEGLRKTLSGLNPSRIEGIE